MFERFKHGTEVTLADEAREFAALPMGEREERYRELRTHLESEYSLYAGPRACRNRANQVARQREAGGNHIRTADRLEVEGEEILRAYDRGVALKSCFAILTGRYDDTLKKGRTHFSSVSEFEDGYLVAEDLRRREINCEAAG